MPQRILVALTRSLLKNTNSMADSARSMFSTNVQPFKIYELRVYNSYPKDFKKIMNLIDQYLHVRTAHSKLFGFWSTDIGSSIFQVVHLWEYESLSQRREIRKGLLLDTVWQTECMQHLIPCMQSMTNALLVPTSGSKINVNFENNPEAVYIFESGEWSGVNPLPVKNDDKGELLVGRFTSVLGDTKSEYRLWRYLDIDAALTESQRRSENLTGNGNSLLLYPCKFSPIS